MGLDGDARVGLDGDVVGFAVVDRAGPHRHRDRHGPAAAGRDRFVVAGASLASVAVPYGRSTVGRVVAVGRTGVLVGALAVAVGAGIAATHDAPAGAPWLALAGAVVTLVAVARRHAPVDERARAPWTVGDRVAVVSVAALASALVLPWGPGLGAHRLSVPQASGSGLLLCTIVAAAGLVAAAIARGAVEVPRAAVWPETPSLYRAVRAVGVVAVVGSLPPPFPPGIPGTVEVPGRMAALSGAIGLLVATAFWRRESDDRRRVGGAVPGPDGERPLAAGSGGVGAPVGEPASPGVDRVGAGAAVAVALLLAATGSLAGPWWRAPFVLHGPMWAHPGRPPLVATGESAAVARSGVDIAGPFLVWSVCGAVVAACVIAASIGARRASLVVVGAASALGAVAVRSLAAGRSGGTPGPWLVVGATAVAVVLAGRAWWMSAPGTRRHLVVPVLLVGLPAALVVDAPAASADSATDGPFVVLVGDDARLQRAPHPDVPAPAFVGDDGQPAPHQGTPASGLTADRAVWLDGEPAFIDDTGRGLVLWRRRDGAVDLLRVATGMVTTEYDYVRGASSGVHGDTIVVDTLEFGGPVLWAEDGASRRLPGGTHEASLGPDGRVWMLNNDDLHAPQLHVAPLDELATAPAFSTVSDSPRVETDDGAGELIAGVEAADGGALVRLRGEAGVVLAVVGPDGSVRTVLGGPPDPRCDRGGSASPGEVVEGRRSGAGAAGDAGWWADVRLDLAVPTADGGAWLVLPAASPDDPRGRALGRIDPDGTVRRVEHALPGIRSLVPSPDGASVLVVDEGGRVLLLDDAESHAEPLPPPDGCDAAGQVPAGAAPDVAASSEAGSMPSFTAAAPTNASVSRRTSSPSASSVSASGAHLSARVASSAARQARDAGA